MNKDKNVCNQCGRQKSPPTVDPLDLLCDCMDRVAQAALFRTLVVPREED